MEIKNTLVLDSSDPLSKALDSILKSGTAVVIMKNKSYCGIIDDRNIRFGISDASKTKCETVCVRAPLLYTSSSVLERLNTFLAGHFKALPVFDEQANKLLGISTRLELLKELLSFQFIPKKPISELMSSPLYTVDAHATIAQVKTKMKEYNSKHLVVIDKGYPIGVVSTFDLTNLLTNPKGHRDDRFIAEIKRPDLQPISDFLREGLLTIEKDAFLQDAVREMVEKERTHILVFSNKKPVGVITAIDVFNAVADFVKEGNEISLVVSGLGADEKNSYEYIHQTVQTALKKFSKLFKLSDAHVHMKKGKSVYSMHLSLHVNDEPLSISAEEYKVGATVDALVNELSAILHKKKSKITERGNKLHRGE